MCTKLKLPIASLVAVLLCCSVSSAGGFGIGPQVGFYKAKDADEGKVMFGAAARMRLTTSLAVEGSVNYRQEKYGDESVTVKSWPVLVTGMLYPVESVYGAVGAGWYNSTFEFNAVPSIADETGQKFGWHFGGGVELPVGTGATLAADLKYVFLDYDFGGLPGSDDYKSDFFIISVGLLFGL